MAEVLGNYQEWMWWALALLLAGLEILLPGVFLIWFAGAAVLVGLLDLIFGLPILLELAIFAVCAGAIGVFAPRYMKNDGGDEGYELLNERGAALVGQTFPVVEAIVQGRGKVKVGDSLWAVMGPDAEPGTLVRVVSAEGTMLQVELV